MKALFKPSALIKQGRMILASNQIPENGADWLMMDLFGMSQMDLLLDNKLLTESERERYFEGVQRLSEHVPLAHVTGFQTFYDRKFVVTPDVLIPRPETEELVACVLSQVKSGILADIGVGSGAIAVSLALEGNFNVHAVDISSKALEIAKRNADDLQATITFHQGDLLQPLIEKGIKLDVLVSNPPYIAREEMHLMSQSVLEYDPHLALFAQDSGLQLYKRMIDNLPLVMKSNGYIFFEIGHAQAAALKEYVQSYYNVDVMIRKDINGLDRILWFKWCV